MKAYKQKSGRWYVRCYDATENKFHYVYGETEKQAMRNGAAWYINHRSDSEKRFGDAYDEFLASRENMSPNTTREYIRYKDRYLQPLCKLIVSRITQTTIDDFMNRLLTNVSVKTAKNVWGTIICTIKRECPDTTITFKFPQGEQKETFVPSEKEFKKIMNAVRGTDLEPPILLAAVCSLRRGEICALRYPDDFEDGLVIVKRAYAKTDDEEWVLKSPKTEAGYRRVPCPDFVLEVIKREGKVYSQSPDALTRRIDRLAHRLKIKGFSMHSLRRYFASEAHAKGIPDRYIQEWGGWSDANTMRKHYQKTIAEENKKNADIWAKFAAEMAQKKEP